MKLKGKINWLRIFNTLIIIVVIVTNIRLSLWKKPERVIEWDVISYYAYLPATFIHNDLALEFFNKQNYKPTERYWPLVSPTGKNVIKTTMGLSLLYSPFFLIAHAITPFTKYERDGFSQPYKQLLVLSSVFYLALGLFFLRKFLQNFFNNYLIGITLLSITLGTNLYIYATQFAPMSHIYDFFLFSAFIYFTYLWHQKPKTKYNIVLGIIVGLISLIRPTNIIIILFFILYNVTSFSSIKAKIKLIFVNYKSIIIISLFALLIWTPQIIYWKIQTGQFLFFSYKNENFFFNSPRILDNLFSYRNGWLLYSPIMVFSIIGILFLLKKENKFLFLPIAIFLIVNIYILSSWWCWWFGGYGNRAYIDSYAVLSIPFIFFLNEIIKWNKIAFIITLHLIILLIGFNLYQSRQYYFDAIHYDSMTKDAYIESFGNLHPTIEYYSALKQPNHFNAMIGINEDIYEKSAYFCGAEKLDSSNNNFQSEIDEKVFFTYCLNRSNEEYFKGKYSIKLDQKDPYGFNFAFDDIKYEEKMTISVWMLDKFNSSGAGIVCTSPIPNSFYKYGNKVVKELPNGWKKIQLDILFPYLENRNILIYAINQNANPVYFDNMLIIRKKIMTNSVQY